MPRERYYKVEKKVICGLEFEVRKLFIKIDGEFVQNSGMSHYYINGDRLNDSSSLELRCPSCKSTYNIHFKRFKNNGPEYRKCGVCIKRENGTLYRPEWYSEESRAKGAEKAKTTFLKKYGVSCSLNGKEQIRKKKATWLKKYGVDNPTKNPAIRNKQQESLIASGKLGWNNKNFYYYSDIFNKTIYYQSSNELDFVKWVESNNFADIDRGPMIRIKCTKGYCVTCDFVITYNNGLKRLVEVKGNHNGWREDKENGRWHVERFILNKYSNEHNYLRFMLLLNNNANVLERLLNDKY